MSSVAAQTYLTPEEYLAFERKATTKHEYLNGQMSQGPVQTSLIISLR